MTKHDYKQTAYYLIYLIRCVLNDKVPAKEKLDKIDLSQLYEVAKNHSLTAMAAYALESAGVYDERFTQAKAKAIRKNAMFDIERERIFADFEKAGIWYMPLKGIILNELYPKNGMRQMCDNDILFDASRADDVKVIMTLQGFDVQKTHSGHDIVFHKKPVCNFEMHFYLFSESKDNVLKNYYSSIKERLIKQSDKEFKYNFTPSDCYIYLNAHENKHFSGGGIGIRSLVDTFMFLKIYSSKLNALYVQGELNKLNMNDFEKTKRILAEKLFDGQMLDSEEKNLLDFYIFSGTYGNIENMIGRATDRTLKSKVRYIRNRLFLNRIQIKNSYPFFYKHKILIPFLFLYRLWLMLSKSRKRVITELKTLIML